MKLRESLGRVHEIPMGNVTELPFNISSVSRGSWKHMMRISHSRGRIRLDDTLGSNAKPRYGASPF
jgi:hypothetical protein